MPYSNRRTGIVVATAAVAVGAAALSAGCSAPAPHSVAPAAAPASAPVLLDHTSASAPKTSTRARHHGSSSGPVHQCLAEQLHSSVVDRTSTGHDGAHYVIRFRNTSHRTCTLSGYPRVVAAGPDGQVAAVQAPLGDPNSERGADPGKGVRAVSLAPSATASAMLQWRSQRAGSPSQCTSIGSRFTVSAPDTAVAVPYSMPVGLCGFVVHPIVHGSTGIG